MQILVGEDSPPARSGFQAAIGRALAQAWQAAGHRVIRLNPDRLQTAGPAGRNDSLDEAVAKTLDEHPLARVHLLTTGPVARSVAAHCRGRGRPFTSSSDRIDNCKLAQQAAESIHAHATCVITPTRAAAQRLATAGIRATRVIRPGVDAAVFQPRVYRFMNLPRPLTLLFGATLDGKDLRDYLDTDLPGSRLVYAPGWTGHSSQGAVELIGYRAPHELAHLISAADISLIPDAGPESILLAMQSLACGVPIASRPNAQLEELLCNGELGSQRELLRDAVIEGLQANRQVCRAFASRHAWAATARQVLATGLVGETLNSYADRDVA